MKRDVLSVLEDNRGRSISGGQIARELGITRAAVHKSVEALRQEGWKIDAVVGCGYCLHTACDIVSETGIRKGLKTNSTRDIKLFDNVGSTNDVVKEYAAQGAEEGLLVVARSQTCGKGRRGRSFFSPDDNGIYMSLLLRPQTDAEVSLFLTVCAAVAVCRAVDAVTGKMAQIKWVNDIYFEGKKLCGILTEAAVEVESGSLDYAVLGIGINVAPPAGGYPPELQGRAVSVEEMAPEAGPVKNRLIAAVVNEFESLYRSFEKKNFMEEYKTRSCIIGKNITVLSAECAENAEVLDIDGEARLVVRMENGEVRKLNSGDVSIRPN